MIDMLRGILSNKKKDPITIQRIPITKARINLGQIVRRVHVNKEYFVLEKDGIPVAGIIDVDELEDYLELREPDRETSDPRERTRVSSRRGS